MTTKQLTKYNSVFYKFIKISLVDYHCILVIFTNKQIL